MTLSESVLLTDEISKAAGVNLQNLLSLSDSISKGPCELV